MVDMIIINKSRRVLNVVLVEFTSMLSCKNEQL